MDMKRQVATLVFHGRYKVIYDTDRKMNAFAVIAISWDKKQKQLERFDCLDSAMQYLTDIVRGGAR